MFEKKSRAPAGARLRAMKRTPVATRRMRPRPAGDRRGSGTRRSGASAPLESGRAGHSLAVRQLFEMLDTGLGLRFRNRLRVARAVEEAGIVVVANPIGASALKHRDKGA